MFHLIKNLFIYYLISSSFKVLISTTSSSPENEIVISGIDNNKLEEVVEFFLDGSNKSLIHETKIITIDKLNSSDIQVLNEKVIQNKENNNYYLNPTENQSIDENEEEIVTKVNSKVLLKFFELLTKSFLGTNRVPSVVESVPNVGSDSDDFYEALMNSFASTNNNKAPVTNSSIKLLKKNNNIGEEKIKSTDKNNTSIQEEEQEKQDSITDVIQSLMKKIISFFGKRNQLKHKRETKAYVRSILKKAILKKKKKLENKV